MKKIMMMAVALLCACYGHAQQFQHRYAPGATIGNGVTTIPSGDGHLMVGTMDKVFEVVSLVVVRTDIDGRFSTSADFNNTYSLFDAVSKAPLTVTSARILEFSDGTGYGVVGSFWFTVNNKTKRGLFYAFIDLSGAIIDYNAYVLGKWAPSDLTVSSVSESISKPGDVFATGNVADADGVPYIWAMRIDQGGKLKWGDVYDFSADVVFSKDLIESPYREDELVIVGGVEISEGKRDGFFHVVSASLGGVNRTLYYDISFEHVNAININSDSKTEGFIMCGPTTYKRDINTFWVFTVDDFGSTIYWSNIYDDKDHKFPVHNPQDVKQRYDAVDDVYEYYVTGFVGAAGSRDVMTLRLDNSGTGVASGLFVYDTGDDEAGASVDVNTSGFGDGVGMYCYDLDLVNAVPQLYAIKSDFAGVSGCNEKFYDPSTDAADIKLGRDQITIPEKFKEYEIKPDDVKKNENKELCYKEAPKGGRLMATSLTAANAAASQINVYPNPATTEVQVTGITFGSNATVSVSVFDITGRLLQQQSLQAGRDNTTVSTTNLAPGTYILKVEGQGYSHVTRLVKE